MSAEGDPLQSDSPAVYIDCQTVDRVGESTVIGARFRCITIGAAACGLQSNSLAVYLREFSLVFNQLTTNENPVSF